MEGAAAVFSSARSNWRTPPRLWKPLAEEFGFTIDVCASKDNAIVPRYIGPDHHDPMLRDAATSAWGRGEVCWMNPPFSRDEGIDIAPFLHAANVESARGNVVVAIVPVRTDTRWWHADVMAADEIRLIPHRVRFLMPDGTESNSAPFPSCIAIWRPAWNVRGRYPRFLTWDYL